MISTNTILKTKSILIAISLLFIFSCEKKNNKITETSLNLKLINEYFNLADNYYDNKKYDSAYYYANKIRLEINPEKDLKKYTTTMFILVICQQLQGDYSGAENSIVETLNAIKKIVYVFKLKWTFPKRVFS